MDCGRRPPLFSVKFTEQYNNNNCFMISQQENGR
jgi:hypothetical protein